MTFSFHELAEVSKEEEKTRSELQAAQFASCCHSKHITHDVSPMYIFTIKHIKESNSLMQNLPLWYSVLMHDLH